MTTRRGLTVAGLFAGIGGLELGLAKGGHESILLCDADPAARLVLENRFTGIAVARDVRRLTELPKSVDLVAAGFPCQDLSQAGKTAGLGGARSGLVREVFRLLRRRRARWVLLENVPFMLHLNRGRALRQVLAELEDLGYRWAYRVVDARSFGLPQRRERVFVLASLFDDPRDVLLADDVGAPLPRANDRGFACGFYWTEGNRGLGWAVDCVPPLKGGSAFGIPSPPAIMLPDNRIVTPDIRDAERLQGFPANWTLPANELGGRHRWRLVGNAVSVEVAGWIGRRLASPAAYGERDDAPLAVGRPWPKAAWNMGSGAHVAAASAWPVRRKLRRLDEFLAYDGAPLSAKAARGFLGRLLASRLNASERLVEALRAHVQGGACAEIIAA